MKTVNKIKSNLTMGIKLKDNIETQARKRGKNPYKDAFKPSDLGLKASDYGSFADYASPDEAKSGKYNKSIILKVVEWSKNGRPRRYILK